MNMINVWFRRIFADPQMVLLLLVVGLMIISAFLFAEMLAPAIAALVIAFLLDGAVEWLKKRGSTHMMAVSLVFISFMLGALVVTLTILPLLLDQIGQFFNEIPKMFNFLQRELLAFSQSFPDVVSEDQIRGWFAKLGDEVANLGPKFIEVSLSGVSSAMTTAVYAVIIPVMIFFFLKDKQDILVWGSGFLPRNRAVLEQVWSEAIQRAGDYARGKVYEIIIVGTVSFVVYQAIGINYATLLAVATGLSVIIPYIGAAAITLPVALVAFVQWGTGSDLAIAVGAYLIIQALDGNLLAPLLFSEVMNIHPNAIIIAILVFGGIWGLWGVFFAIPLATVANSILRVWRERMATLQSEEAAE
ncbi:AI-2E family transporter [Temperatibacter marinus]|uniref:AI-2E family transporter n=1 Tax=Temperatibacter marinus TaxID=1456591 RepID=A0AA52EJ61_9PROT|nr:AI-2E family transporter [Temperatibacter marinus]WND04128.1 AI-2E family transporter [Temperatibacter marinus]